MQIDVLEAYQLLIILSGTCPVVLGNALLGLTALLERSVFTVPLDALDPMDPNAGIKRAKRISSHTSFFKAGYCLGKMLVCIVKSTQLSSTFKTLEPIDQNVRGRSKPTFKKLINGGNDTLKLFRVGIFYLLGLEYADFMLRNFTYRSSLHRYITSRRKCVLDAPRALRLWISRHWIPRDLLDPSDESLEFVRRREGLKPMAIYRIQNEFLLCYDGKKSLSCCSNMRLMKLQNLLFMSTSLVECHGRTLWCIGREFLPDLVSNPSIL